MWTTALVVLIVGLSQSYAIDTRVDPMVLTKQGLVRGARSSDEQYSLFLGIPFAVVDANNPFGDALPGPIFNEVLEAVDDSAACPQNEMNTVHGNLDCLHINVYVPSSASSTNPLPVMVWIHGGGFAMGSSGRDMFGPQYIIRHNVILVAFNYRLGPYGFMCLDIPSVPGNSGLKDQQAGLRWVNENIAAFGGDINSITVFGESAGAMSVELQILSPGSNGLFHRAIMQSGSALVEAIVVHSRPSAPLEILNHLGFTADSLEDALEIIKGVPTDDVIRATTELGLVFKPCIEKSFEGVNNFMVTYPDITLGSAQYESVPMIIGFNSHEQLGKYFPNINSDTYFDQIQDIFYSRINGSFEFKSEEQLLLAAQIFQQFYLGTKAVSKEVVFDLAAFDSDAHFNHPIERSVKYHLEKSDKPFYQYVFAYFGELSQMNLGDVMSEPGAVHGDDLGYLFKPYNSPDQNNPQDQLVIDRLSTMWTNFAKQGDPTPETSELLPVRWPVVTRDSRDYLYIDKDLAVNQKPVHDRLAFWDLFFVAFGEYYRMVWEGANYY